MKTVLYPLVKRQSRRGGTKRGKGFSTRELDEVSLSLREARERGISVDVRRSSAYLWNIIKLRDFLGVS